LRSEPVSYCLVPTIIYRAVSVRVIVAAEVPELIVAETQADARSLAELTVPGSLDKIMRIPNLRPGIPKIRLYRPIGAIIRRSEKFAMKFQLWNVSCANEW